MSERASVWVGECEISELSELSVLDSLMSAPFWHSRHSNIDFDKGKSRCEKEREVKDVKVTRVSPTRGRHLDLRSQVRQWERDRNT